MKIDFALAGALALLPLATPARAAESFDACTAFVTSLPATLSSAGRYCLTKDLATTMTSGYALEVTANNVTLDCNGFRIGNLGGGPNANTWGVYTNRTNTRVTGCLFRGFFAGIEGGAASHHAVVEGNSFQGTRRAAVYITGDGALVRDNRFLGIGGVVHETVAIQVQGGTSTVRGNVIDGVVSTGAYAVGVNMTDGHGMVADNTLRGVLGATPADTYAMRFEGSVEVERNRLEAATDAGVAFTCTYSAAIRDNSIIGFAKEWTACPDDGGNYRRAAGVALP